MSNVLDLQLAPSYESAPRRVRRIRSAVKPRANLGDAEQQEEDPDELQRDAEVMGDIVEDARQHRPSIGLDGNAYWCSPQPPERGGRRGSQHRGCYVLDLLPVRARTQRRLGLAIASGEKPSHAREFGQQLPFRRSGQERYPLVLAAFLPRMIYRVRGRRSVGARCFEATIVVSNASGADEHDAADEDGETRAHR